MCYMGSRNDTARELKKLLCISNLTDEQIESMNRSFVNFLTSELGTDTLVQTANKLLVVNDPFSSVSEHFEQQLTAIFQSEVECLDLAKSPSQAAQAINDWVSSKTNKKVKNLLNSNELDQLPAQSILLVNAVYFKARWAHLFVDGLTKKENFYLKDGRVKKVNMMELRSKLFKVMLNPMGLNASVIEIPYHHYTLSLTIVLPDKEDQLDELISRLNPRLVENLLKDDHNLSKLVNLQIPKFKFESKLDVMFNLKIFFNIF